MADDPDLVWDPSDQRFARDRDLNRFNRAEQGAREGNWPTPSDHYAVFTPPPDAAPPLGHRQFGEVIRVAAADASAKSEPLHVRVLDINAVYSSENAQQAQKPPEGFVYLVADRGGHRSLLIETSLGNRFLRDTILGAEPNAQSAAPSSLEKQGGLLTRALRNFEQIPSGYVVSVLDEPGSRQLIPHDVHEQERQYDWQHPVHLYAERYAPFHPQNEGRLLNISGDGISEPSRGLSQGR